VTNTPTIGFSDADGGVTPYPATGNYAQEDVAVQPFVICKSTAIGAVSNYVNNVTWEQLEYGIPQGRIPVSAWDNQDGADRTNNFIYLIQRTSDSGTRRCETAQEYYGYGDTVGIYVYDHTNNFFYLPTNPTNSLIGNYPYGVVGPAGLGNANLNWGYGYVGGGDIANELNYNSPSNQAIAMLSMGDSKGVGASNWLNVVSFDGMWPTAAGAGIRGEANGATNDFSPICLGYYPCWGTEVLVHIVDPSANPPGDQDISQTQLGNNTTPGSFLGVFNAQTKINGGSPLIGSVENEIYLSQTNSATAHPFERHEVESRICWRCHLPVLSLDSVNPKGRCRQLHRPSVFLKRRAIHTFLPSKLAGCFTIVTQPKRHSRKTPAVFHAQ